VTDFNEELARATLLERPNSFFIGNAAPEDVDSDSGYSSPQHRQMTAAPSDLATAAATPAIGHSVVTVTTSPRPASSVLETAHGVQQPALVTYVPDGRHLPMIYAPYPFQGSPSVNMFLSAGKEPEVASNHSRQQPSTGSHRGGVSKTRHRGCGGKKASKQQSNVPKSLTSNETTDAVTSQVVTYSEPALPFDDVDEFPYLLSAADGLIASQGASVPQPPNPPSTCRPVEVMTVDMFYLIKPYSTLSLLNIFFVLALGAEYLVQCSNKSQQQTLCRY